MLTIYALTSTVLAALITVLPLLPFDHWLARSWEFPRLQICTLLIVNSGFLSIHLTHDYIALCLAITLLCLSFQLLWILPYTPLYPVEVKRGGSGNIIKILTSNVLMTNRCADKLLAQIDKHTPDIVVTLESDHWWQRAMYKLHAHYPFRVNIPLDNLYGMHVFSRYPLHEVKKLCLIQDGIPSVHCKVEMECGTLVDCHFLHPAPPSPTENTSAAPRDKELLRVARSVSPDTIPTIVTGDLNDVAWSPTTRQFRKISKLRDPRIGRGAFNTFHADYWFARWPLDHIFHSHHFTLRKIKRLPNIGSDHFPLLSELILVNQEVQ